MNDMTPLLSEGIKILATVAAAYGSVKATLNGARQDITEIKGDVKEIRGTLVEHGEAIAVLKERRDEART